MSNIDRDNLMNDPSHSQLHPQLIIQNYSMISERTSMIIKSINESTALRQLIEKQSKMMSELSKVITELLKKLAPRYITKEQYELYVSNARQLGTSCWGIHPDFPPDYYRISFDEVNSIVERLIKNVDANIESCFDAIIKEMKTDYVCVIKEAEVCFKNRCYRACCSLLLSQIDRIFQSFLYELCKKKKIYAEDVRNVLNQKIVKDYDICHHDISRMLLWVSLKETFDIIYKDVNLEQYSIEDDQNSINRHCIQHGYSLHTFSDCDCLQLSTILYSVICMTDEWRIIYSRSFSMMGVLVERSDN